MEIEACIEKQQLMCDSVKFENERLKSVSSAKNKSTERDRPKPRLIQNLNKKQAVDLHEKTVIKRSISPAFPSQKVHSLSKSNVNLQSKKSLIRDESMGKIQTERQLTSKRRFN